MSCVIIGGGIPDKLWPKFLLVMTHISNLLPTSSLNSFSLFKAFVQSLPNLQYLCILGSIVYVFIHEEEHNVESDKSATWAKREMFVGYDGETIY